MGKIYSVLADRLAGRLVRGAPGLEELTLWLTSEIGRPVDQPRVVYVLAHLARPDAALPDVAPAAEAMITSELAQLPAFCRELAADPHASSDWRPARAGRLVRVTPEATVTHAT